MKTMPLPLAALLLPAATGISLPDKTSSNPPITPDPSCEDEFPACLTFMCTNQGWFPQCRSTCGGCEQGQEDGASPVNLMREAFYSPRRGVTGKNLVVEYPSWEGYGDGWAGLGLTEATHVNYLYAGVRDGLCVLSDEYVDTQKFFPDTDSWSDPHDVLRGNFNRLHLLKDQDPLLKLLITLGGESRDFEAVVASGPAQHARFAQSCVDLFVGDFKFDGISVDWSDNSLLDKGSGESVTSLLTALRDALDSAGGAGQHKLLTLGTSNAKEVDMGAVVPLVDFVNIHSSSNSQEGSTSLNAFLEAGLPKDKAVVGLPAHGRASDDHSYDEAVVCEESSNAMREGLAGVMLRYTSTDMESGNVLIVAHDVVVEGAQLDCDALL